MAAFPPSKQGPPCQPASVRRILAIDFGSQQSMTVCDDGEILLTETGGTSLPTLVFLGSLRQCGEEAAANIASGNTIPLGYFLGCTPDEVLANPIYKHRKTVKISGSSPSSPHRLAYVLEYGGEEMTIPAAAVLSTLIRNIHERACKALGSSNPLLSFSLPPNGLQKQLDQMAVIRDACSIVGIDAQKDVVWCDSADALASVYIERKFSALLPTDQAALEGKNVLLVEMGQMHTTLVVINIGQKGGDNKAAPAKVAVSYDGALGGISFDLCLFDHFSEICASKFNCGKIEPSTKKGNRLFAACERIRKLLSQLPETSVSVENLSDGGDITLSLSRNEMSSITASLLQKFSEMVKAIVDKVGGVSAVEILGGASRMVLVQNALLEALPKEVTVLGAKLDDSSVAMGAVLVATKKLANSDENNAAQEPEESSTQSLASDDLQFWTEKEKKMLERDAQTRTLLERRNSVEGFILEHRNILRSKLASLIPVDTVSKACDDIEGLLWEWDENSSNEELLSKIDELMENVRGHCKGYVEAMEAEKKKVEEALNQGAKEAEDERAAREASGLGDEDDNDNRRLKKADRMRLVVKNKEEGNELFKGGNLKHAAARYHKALSHAAKFFDLSKEDEAEVNALKTTLYINLATCYIKLCSWEQVLRNCNEALALDPNNAKAYFKRSQYHELAKKDFDEALKDLKTCQKLSTATDPNIDKAIQRVKKEIEKIKAKEKSMWGKAFA